MAAAVGPGSARRGQGLRLGSWWERVTGRGTRRARGVAPWGGCARLLPLLSSGRLRVLAVSAGAALGAQCSAVPLTRGVVAWEVGSGHQGLPHAGVHIPTPPSPWSVPSPAVPVLLGGCFPPLFLTHFSLFNKFLVAGAVDFLPHKEDTREQEGRSCFMRCTFCFLSL